MMSAKVILLACVLVCLQGAETSQEKAGPGTCVYNNVTYQENTKFHAEKCLSGCCEKCGEIKLTPICCEYEDNAYQLDSTFQPETCKSGYCNLYGQVELTPTCCEYENQTYNLGSDFKISPCYFGYCDEDGQIAIAVMDCARPQCPDPVYEEDQCCPKCPDSGEPQCFFEGTWYKPGPINTTNPCQYCVCPQEGGDAWCAWASCAACPSGYETITPKPGQCCPECQSNVTCEYNGQIYQVGPIDTNNPCEFCECSQYAGAVQCMYATCAPCPTGSVPVVPQPGQCCQDCESTEPTCEYNGQIYQVGHMNTSDPCEYCDCNQYGEVLCAMSTPCPPCPTGYDFVPAQPGECCHECQPAVPTCQYNGQTYQVGHMQTNNSCESCDCPPEGGDAICAYADCPPCPTGYQTATAQPGQCCQECEPTEPTCEYNGQTYQVGEIETNDPCTECYCPPYSDQVECSVASCPSCEYGYVSPANPDRCCQECETEPNCEYNGKRYPVGEIETNDPCTECYCPTYSDQVECYMASCESCPYGYVSPANPDRCCQECETKPNCEYNGQRYQQDDIPTNDPCKVCYCPPDGGKAECVMTSCPECVYGYANGTNPGQCCQECETEPNCEYNGKRYPVGEIETNDPCTECYCPPYSNQVECSVASCPSCEYGYVPVANPDRCCQECETEPFCDYKGQRYPAGKIPTDDPCQECYCLPDGGQVECNELPCPDCPPYYAVLPPEPGQCCPQCEERYQTMP